MSTTKLTIGTVQFGMPYGINNKIGQVSQTQVFELLDLAYANEIDTFDTAANYGEACQVLKQYLKLRPQNKLKIYSKFITQQQEVTAAIEECFYSLELSQLEGIYFHRFDDYQKFSKWDLLKQYLSHQKIKHVGVSLYNLEELKICIEDSRIDLIQIPFNVLDNHYQKIELLKKAKRRGKKIVARSVYLQGAFFLDENQLELKFKELAPLIAQVKGLADSYQLTYQDLLLRYVITRPYIDEVVVGLESKEQLLANIQSAQKNQINSDLVMQIESLSIPPTTLLNPASWGKQT